MEWNIGILISFATSVITEGYVCMCMHAHTLECKIYCQESNPPSCHHSNKVQGLQCHHLYITWRPVHLWDATNAMNVIWQYQTDINPAITFLTFGKSPAHIQKTLEREIWKVRSAPVAQFLKVLFQFNPVRGLQPAKLVVLVHDQSVKLHICLERRANVHLQAEMHQTKHLQQTPRWSKQQLKLCQTYLHI